MPAYIYDPDKIVPIEKLNYILKQEKTYLSVLHRANEQLISAAEEGFCGIYIDQEEWGIFTLRILKEMKEEGYFIDDFYDDKGIPGYRIGWKDKI